MTEEMVEALRRLVEAESFSTDREGIARCGAVIDELCRGVLGAGTQPAGAHRVWRRDGDGPPVLLLCHFDTVWPPGTLAGFPFQVEDGLARGPGTFDMKAGIVQCLWALRDVPAGPVTVLFTADEEIGSPTSRALIEDEARGARAVLVLEPAEGRNLKLARKGIGGWRIEVMGRAAHAGLEPEKGVNAVVELARQVEAISALADERAETTVTVTMAGGGSQTNVVPESAWCEVDVRMWTDEEAERIRRELERLRPTLSGARIRVAGALNRGPLEREATEMLYRRVLELGYDVGGSAVGGASDGNFAGPLGVPTLDGLGAVGGGAHARDEHVIVDEMPRRAEMVARLMTSLLEDG